MINEKQTKKYCSEDISLIDNYDKAIADTTQTWHCHHKLEVQGQFFNSAKLVIKCKMYYYRPASDLIFLTSSEHRHIHNIGRKLSTKTRKKLSTALKGKNSGKQHTTETRQKISTALIGRIPWNANKQLSNDTCKKMQLAHIGKHWWNNGVVEVNQVECPEGFKRGRICRHAARKE